MDTVKYIPSIGDVVKLSRGEPGTIGYVERIKVVVGNREQLTEDMIDLVELKTTDWNVEFVNRNTHYMKVGTICWAKDTSTEQTMINLKETDEHYYEWGTWGKNGLYLGRHNEARYKQFREARLVPADIMKEAEEWVEDEDEYHGCDCVAASILDRLLIETRKQEKAVEES